MSEIQKIRGKVDFGIITVRPDEFDAVLYQFKMTDSVMGTRRYALSTLKTNQNTEYLVAMVRSPHQGFPSAQQTTESLITDLDPQWILLVGIGGGVPDNEFTLGDVVLGMRIVDFSVQAAVQSEPPEFDMRGSYAHRDVEDLLAHLPALKPELEGWTDSIPLPLPSVNFDPDRFNGNDSWRGKVRKSLEHHFQTGQSRERIFWPGTIGTSNSLIKDTDLVLLVSRFARSINAFEMEAGGVLFAARSKKPEYPVLDIRGLSDVIGYEREGAWTEYACHSAAAFTHHLLKTGTITKARASYMARQQSPKKTTQNKPGSSSFSNLDSIFHKGYMNPSDCDQVGGSLNNIKQTLKLDTKRLRDEYSLKKRAGTLLERVEAFREISIPRTAQTDADGKKILKDLEQLLDDVIAMTAS